MHQDLILPKDMGGRDENLHRAWYGDKVLGAHIATFTLNLFQDSLDQQVASRIASVALSNRFLYQKASIIIPENDPSTFRNESMAGTIVETAVSRMSKPEIDDLSQYLVKEAINELIRQTK